LYITPPVTITELTIMKKNGNDYQSKNCAYKKQKRRLELQKPPQATLKINLTYRNDLQTLNDQCNPELKDMAIGAHDTKEKQYPRNKSISINVSS